MSNHPVVESGWTLSWRPPWRPPASVFEDKVLYMVGPAIHGGVSVFLLSRLRAEIRTLNRTLPRSISLLFPNAYIVCYSRNEIAFGIIYG